jgi:hypothetical protein
MYRPHRMTNEQHGSSSRLSDACVLAHIHISLHSYLHHFESIPIYTPKKCKNERLLRLCMCAMRLEISQSLISLRFSVSLRAPGIPTTSPSECTVYIPQHYNASGGTAFNVLATSFGAIWLFCKLLTWLPLRRRCKPRASFQLSLSSMRNRYFLPSVSRTEARRMCRRLEVWTPVCLAN